MDLTPRTGPGGTGPEGAVASAPRRRAPSSKRRKIGVSVVLAVLLAAMAIILFEGLSNATMYFYNADEAVAKRASLEDKRFRLQGQVVAGTVRDTGETVDFDVTYNGVTVAVQNQGSPPELFQEGIPVVLEGKWAGGGDGGGGDASATGASGAGAGGFHFQSDRILVKHTSEYKAANPGRVPANAP